MFYNIDVNTGLAYVTFSTLTSSYRPTDWRKITWWLFNSVLWYNYYTNQFSITYFSTKYIITENVAEYVYNLLQLAYVRENDFVGKNALEPVSTGLKIEWLQFCVTL